MHYISHKQLLLGIALVALPLARVWAQAIDERSPLDVGSLPEELEYPQEQQGVRVGALQLLPSASMAIAYDSNIFAAHGSRDEEALSIGQGLVRVQSASDGADLEGTAFVRARRFADAHDQDTTEYGLAGKLETPPDLQNELSAGLLAQRRFESRTELETPNTREVSFYKDWRGEFGYQHTFNRFALGSTLRARRVDYEEQSQEFRDRLSYRGELRGTYETGTSMSLLALGYYNKDDYRTDSPLVASAHSVGALIGMQWLLPDIAELELAGGYFQRTFAQDLGELSGLTLRATATLHPTRLTMVRASLSREDAPTRVVGAYGKVRTDGRLEVSHEYSRNINLFARARAILDKLDIVQRTDRTYLSEIGINYLLSRRYIVKAEYDYASRSSVVDEEIFVRHLTSVSLLGRF